MSIKFIMSQASDKKRMKPPMGLDPMTSQTKHQAVVISTDLKGARNLHKSTLQHQKLLFVIRHFWMFETILHLFMVVSLY